MTKKFVHKTVGRYSRTMKTISIKPAEQTDAPRIAAMLQHLLNEIADEASPQHSDIDTVSSERLCRELLRDGRYIGFVAHIGPSCVGFLTLCPAYALYVPGALGIIQELFVEPAFRSCGVGSHLLDAAFSCARSLGWKRLEVATPPLARLPRSFAFYQHHGFVDTGGPKLKCKIT